MGWFVWKMTQYPDWRDENAGPLAIMVVVFFVLIVVLKMCEGE